MIEGIITDVKLGNLTKIWVRRGENKQVLKIPFNPKIYVLEEKFYKFESLFSSIIVDVDFIKKNLGFGKMRKFAEITVSYPSYLKLRKVYKKLSFDIYHLDVYEELMLIKVPSLNPVSIKVGKVISGEYLWGYEFGYPEELKVIVLMKAKKDFVVRDYDEIGWEQYHSLDEVLREKKPDVIFTNVSLDVDGALVADMWTFKKLGIEGLMEKAYFTSSSPKRIVRLTIGNSVASRQDYYALQRGLILPIKDNPNVEVSRLRDYLYVDTSPLIITPKPGIYNNVASIDFSSMFPHIITKYNISYENTSINGIREIKEKGFLPMIIEEPLKRRLYFKRFKSKSARLRAYILKGLLVACYGYAGKNNNRFGNTYINHWVNRIASEILSQVIEMAKKFNLEIVYADTDSVFARYSNREALLKFLKKVSDHIGIPVKIEHDFTKVAFVERLSDGMPSIKRYYGLTKRGKIIIKGLMAVRRNIPQIIKRAQLDIIKNILTGKDFMATYKEYKEAITSGKLTIKDLIFEVELGKDYREYRGKNSLSKIAKLLKPRKGTVLKLFYKNNKPTPINKYSGHYDTNKYLSLLNKALKELKIISKRAQRRLKSTLTIATD